MKDTPITFSAQMVRATLDGRKTQARVPLKHPERLELDDGDAPAEQREAIERGDREERDEP